MNIEKQIEFDQIKARWMDLAVTKQAKETIRHVTFYLSEQELTKQLADTTQGRALMEQLGMPPLQDVEEVKEILMAAEKGDCLMPGQLERLETVLAAIRRLKDYLARGKAYENPLGYYEENFDELPGLREEIQKQIRNGAVDDYASGELQKIRSRMAKCEEQMKLKAEQVMQSGRKYMADHYCTSRDGRICVPVRKEFKQKISGSVIGKSATGSTLFIEPSGVAKYYEQLQLLKLDEENEVYRILYTLSALAADAAAVMKENIRLVEKLDFIFSKGKLSMDLKAAEPSVTLERTIILKDARHPLMDRESCVPLQFEIGGDIRGIVITGPNTGGKTVAIKTVMLNCMMAQCGLHVTRKEAVICMNSAYLCDIGDGQDITENLSTFSAHIKNVLHVLQEVNRESFVIMDELGSGTDPAEGMGIAIAILEELKKSGCLFLVTTHYPQVKDYADQTVHLTNARMTFDKDSLRPTYQMVIGEAGESCAFYIAERLGMPEEMLATAAGAAYGKQAAKKYLSGAVRKGNGRPYQPQERSRQRTGSRISRNRKSKSHAPALKFGLGDSVMISPDRKIGIVCVPVNEKGVLRVQLPDKKIWISHKRVTLLAVAAELYPEDYDFSILFDTVKNRKIRHDMERKYTQEIIRHEYE